MKRIFVLEKPINNIKEPHEVFERIREINIDYNQENYIVICLDSKNQVLSAEVIFKGGASECLIDPKIIFRYALKNNAVRIITSHNHPSGNLEPSQEDWNVYRDLKELGEKLDLPVLDSIIFNKKQYYSMEMGE